MAAASPRSRWLLLVLIVLFFGSGACALIYQVLWLRMLGWVFGVTVHAASTVWAMFMLGLAAGGLLAGRVGDRVARPLAWFGAAELLIGVTALLSPFGLTALQRVYAAAYPLLPDGAAGLVGARFAIAFLVLIVPTTLMGSTLPLMLKASATQASGTGADVGLLYGSNALGAILGTIAAGLYLIPGLGIQRTFLIAASLNAAIGVCAIALSRPVRSGDASQTRLGADVAATDAPRLPVQLTSAQLRALLLVFSISGAVGLALEVVWFRVLALFVRPTVYGFAVMLAVVLTGISLGSYLVAPTLRKVRDVTPIAVVHMFVGIAILLSFAPLAILPQASQRLGPYLDLLMPGYLVYAVVASVMVILPTVLLSGLAFPIGLHLWTASGGGGQTAERAGRLYFFNVCGAIVGSLVAGFLLLPMLGSRRSLVALGVLNFGAGLALLAASRAAMRTRATLAVLGIGLMALAIRYVPDPIQLFLVQRYPAMAPIYVEEGLESTAVVHEFSVPNGRRRVMSLNGNHQAGTDGPTMFVHRRIGHLPMIVHPLAREALVVGLGGGATAGAVSLHEGVDVDVVELAESVVNAAKWFDTINYGVVGRPNVHIRIDDGRNFLMLTPRRYDVIAADLIQPVMAGSGNLYSREYFELVRRALKPGGIAMQWIPGTDAEFKAIARTFLRVFPQTTAWGDGALFIGSLEPLKLRKADFDWKLTVPGRAQGIRDGGLSTFDDLLKTFVAGPDEIRAFVGEGPILTDDRPLTEYFLSLPRDKTVNLSGLRGDVSRYMATDPSPPRVP